MKHVAVYSRVSSGKQQHASQAPDLERFAAAAESEGLPVKWYRDTFTGRTMDRPGWQSLEADMRDGKVSKLVCWKIDRLGRTARGLLALFDELRRLKVDLVCVTGGIMGLDSPEGRLMAGMVAQFAEYDNELRTERIRAGIAVARNNGVVFGGYQGTGISKKAESKLPKVRQLLAAKIDKKTIATACGLDRGTVSRLVKKIQGEAVGA